MGRASAGHLPSTGIPRMKPHVAFFNLRLGAGRTIAYTDLCDIWGRASRCSEIGLRKTAIGRNEHDKACVYTLCAPRELGELAQVEARLRELLSEQRVGPAIHLTRLT
jgi:hypothetical protein